MPRRGTSLHKSFKPQMDAGGTQMNRFKMTALVNESASAAGQKRRQTTKSDRLSYETWLADGGLAFADRQATKDDGLSYESLSHGACRTRPGYRTAGLRLRTDRPRKTMACPTAHFG